MSDLCVFTLFDQKTGRPRCTGIKNNNVTRICDLYRPGAGKTIKKIDATKHLIRKIILESNFSKRIIISDFKSHISSFDLPRDHRLYNVYDVHLPDVRPTNSFDADDDLIRKVLDRMSQTTLCEYQRLIAQASVVYQDLEDVGLLINHNPVFPKWSQKTFSGRSKTVGFNIQGFSENFHVTPYGGHERDVLIHFDWVCADIRVASILSQDQLLIAAFNDSDPYLTMMEELNSGSDEKISRSECKRYLLKSINSMDFTSVVLTEIYCELGRWVMECKEAINDGKTLETILHRKFRPYYAKNKLAVLNGIMQGSVVHAMQSVLKRVWDKLPSRLIAEIHDCLIVSASPDSAEIKAIIDIITPIMLYPFDGILDSNPIFPVNVSVGNKWRQRKLYKTYR